MTDNEVRARELQRLNRRKINELSDRNDCETRFDYMVRKISEALDEAERRGAMKPEGRYHRFTPEHLAEIKREVIEAEREACAKLVEAPPYYENDCAEAIRSRQEKKDN